MKFVYILLSIFLGMIIFLFFLFFDIREGEIVVRDKNKALLKEITKRINEIVYDKATQYNPEGDLVPDEIDNEIKEKIRDNIKTEKN